MSTPRRLALFLDGTWNTLNDNTNVWRLKSLCANDVEQKVYYSVGVGTARGERVTGGMFGIGINEEVIAAYEWLVENYQQNDRIFIFGFSRGAFTARSLAGLVSKCGLLKLGAPLSINQLYARYRRTEGPSILALQGAEPTTLSNEERWLQRYSRPVPVWFQGVWDTVGTLGVPLPFLPHVSSHDFDFLETDLRINDTYGFHALAIDEHREAFKPTLWVKTTYKHKDNIAPRTIDHVEQRWFSGAHANVGGGYENDLLPQAPLIWIAEKAVQHGLVLKDTLDADPDAAHCALHDSFAEMAHGLYEVLTLGKRYFRPIGAEPVEGPDTIVATINETIDLTVFDRLRADPLYRPENLLNWAKQRNVDATKIARSVRADDASPVP
jgi:uncharacterized protein (DUF2235 family)